MADDTDTVSGILLAKEPSGERHLKLALLSPEKGLVACLLRVATKATTPAPDLFDYAEVSLNPPKGGGPRFAGEYRIIRREPEIGADYGRLAIACRLALILTRNPPPDGSSAEVHDLCVEAVQAFAGRPRPDATLFKSLWKLVRGEGYPVQEHWLRGLDRGDREAVASILNCPLDAQVETADNVSRLTRRLERWLENECHFVLP
ncbi:MAG: hypothetical protein LBV12_05560 [Puniceicoccales bacterium]|jgi:recombinational DNA repair protein (RecF pathway)|nr:hypothetical protein [Puniceicoccales bacterium]